MTDTPQMPAKRKTVGEAWDEHAYRYLVGLAFLALALGTVVYRYAEEWTWVDSFYFSAVTLATVGYGDLAPTSDFSKIFTVFYILGGISLLASTLDALLQHRARRVKSRVAGR
jgi:hypothetical protein